LAHLHFHTQQATVEVPMEYQCGACGLLMDVLVRGRGAAKALVPGEELASRAHTSAMKSVFMRLELWPCPNCGNREYDLWRRGWIRTALLGALAIGVSAVVMAFKSARAFGADLEITVGVLAGLGLLIEGLIAGGMLYELRASRTAVRPLANAGSGEGT
jgi:hypothetical protein